MNKVILMGRLTRDPEIRYSQNDSSMAVARYTIAVDRRVSRNGGDDQQTADFIGCVAFGRNAEFAERYLKKGTKIAIEGRIQTGSYTNRDGQRVYTTDVVVENHEFCEGRGNNGGGAYDSPASYGAPVGQGADPGSDFMNIPEGIEEDLPFN